MELPAFYTPLPSAILNHCAGNYSFPALDNSYVYLAATQLALFRSSADWTGEVA
jgi:hypothetical protein